MQPLTRRVFLNLALRGAAGAAWAGGWPAGAAPAPAAPSPAPDATETAAIADLVNRALHQFRAPGLSLAVARHGQMVYQQGFGLADPAQGKPMSPASRFRIASVSKPITSVAIFTLIEQGRLGLHDPVFGAGGHLKFDYADHYPAPLDQITIYHLLTHTCGGWQNDGADPMFCDPKLSQHELIRSTVERQPLQHAPGTHYAYSNFGYCLLGRVIEKITGQPYAQFVRQAVLAKCGIEDMQLGGNTRAQRAPGEVVYEGAEGAVDEAYGMNVTRMDAHGGWIATAADLVRFAMHVDGFHTTASLLQAETLQTMTTASAVNPGYACGWCVNRAPNWWHTGSLPGTLTILVRTASGLCWAAGTNARREGLNLDDLMWRVVRAVPAWQA